MATEISSRQTSGTLLTYKSMNISGNSTVIQTSGKQTQTSDTVRLHGASVSALTYNGSMQVQDAAEAGYEKLRSYVADLLQKQGVTTKVAVGNETIDFEKITPDEAQDLISEDGYFGVEQTSERIFQFAIGIAGGDTSRIDAIKEGIEKGFAEAKEAFGDWLPEISYNTYDRVMEKLDNWVAESTTVA